tara:strand:- start:1567 stop:1680 length:114 start_codon:yes stop_codon:yes gene_type:complete
MVLSYFYAIFIKPNKNNGLADFIGIFTGRPVIYCRFI